jgi:hypothetical protein
VTRGKRGCGADLPHTASADEGTAAFSRMQHGRVAAAGWRSDRMEQFLRGEQQGAAQEFVFDFASGKTLADPADPAVAF